jgi:hypothetical protein
MAALVFDKKVRDREERGMRNATGRTFSLEFRQRPESLKALHVRRRQRQDGRTVKQN